MKYLSHILRSSYGYLVCWQVYFSVAHVLEWDLNDFFTWEALSHWLPSSALCGGLDHSGPVSLGQDIILCPACVGWRASPFQGRVVSSTRNFPSPIITFSTPFPLSHHRTSRYFPSEASSPLAQDAVSLPSSPLHIWRVISRRAPKQGLSSPASTSDCLRGRKEEEGE